MTRSQPPLIRQRLLSLLTVVAIVLALPQLTLPRTASAQTSLTPPVLAVVSIEAIFARSTAWQQAVAHLQSQQQILQQAQRQQQQELSSQSNQLNEQKQFLTDEAFASQQRQLLAQRDTITAGLQQRANALQQIDAALRQQLLAQVDLATRQIGTPRGIDIVIATSQQGNILLISSEYDITAAVIAQLNANFVSFPVAALRSI